MANASKARAFSLSSSTVGSCGLVLIVLFMVGLMLAPANSRAASEPFRIDFDQSEMKVGALSNLPLGEAASDASLEGTIDGNGIVEVPRDKFILPRLEITEPVSMKIFMAIESDATGTFDRETGELVLNSKAGVWVSVNVAEVMATLQSLGIDASEQLGPLAGMVGGLGDLTCGFSPMDVTFSTENEGGARFRKGPRGPGAITTEWSQLGPFAGKTKVLVFDVCKMIKSYAPSLVEGALGSSLPDGLDLGGLDLASMLDNLDNVNLGPSSLTLSRRIGKGAPGRDDSSVAGPRLGVSVSPKRRKVNPGRSTVFTVKVKNSGDAVATRAKVCFRSPGARVTNGKRCRNLIKVMAGATQTRRYRVKAPRQRRRAVKVSVVVNASNATRTKTQARLLVGRG